MIREFLRPETLNQALALKEQYGDSAVYMAGGARLNAAATGTDREVAISLSGLNLAGCEKTVRGWEIGALTTLQQLIDIPELPEGLKAAAGLVYSRNMRNQITLGGEVAAGFPVCLIMPTLLALKAQAELAEGDVLSVEEYQSRPVGLITKIIVPEKIHFCRYQQIQKSAASQPVVGVSLVVVDQPLLSVAIAATGVAKQAVRLHDVETIVMDYLAGQLKRELLEQQVADSVFPDSDFQGSADYKRQMCGVLVGALAEEFKVWSK